MSMRGKRFSPRSTRTFAGREPHFPALSQVVHPAQAPICPKSLAQELGMKGLRSTPEMRRHSSRLYMTRARRGRLASSLARTQGAVSSIYLLARAMSLKTSARASWKA